MSTDTVRVYWLYDVVLGYECPDHEEHLTCANCGKKLWEPSLDCPDVTVWPDCPECMSVYDCMSGNCDCKCAECGKDLGDGDCAGPFHR